MHSPLCPSLYQINTRVWLTELSHALGRPATLDDIQDAELDRLATMGFDWIWLLSVWQTGPAGQRVSRTNPEWQHEFQDTLPDLREEDIAGSGFAITGYSVHDRLGGDAALARLRERLRSRGLRLLLDFRYQPHRHQSSLGGGAPRVLPPGHRAGPGTRAPELHVGQTGPRRFAVGARTRPEFAGWPDTLQLDYGNRATQEAMVGELLRIAKQCDGLRWDMAMLVLPDVFERTWGRRAPLFSPEATVAFARASQASASWGSLLGPRVDHAAARVRLRVRQQLYDRLREGHARPVREHSTPGSTTRASWRASWKITTSRGRPPPSRPDGRGGGHHHLLVARAAVLPTRVSSRVAGSAFRRTSSARRSKQATASCSGSPTACSPCFAIRPFATATGGCSNRRLRGRATGRRTVSSHGSGPARPATAGSWRSTTRHTRASVTSPAAAGSW